MSGMITTLRWTHDAWKQDRSQTETEEINYGYYYKKGQDNFFSPLTGVK